MKPRYGIQIIFQLLLAVPAGLKAQDPAPKHEIGVNLLMLSADLDNGPEWDYCAVPGIYYKRFFGPNGIRVGADYYQHNEFRQYGPFADAMNRKTGELRLGYERRFGERKLQGFVFADLVYRYSKTQRINSGSMFYADVLMPFAPSSDYTKTERHEYGGVAGIGLRYNFSRRFSLVYEAGFQAGAWRENALTFQRHTGGTLLRLYPLRSLAVAIRF